MENNISGNSISVASLTQSLSTSPGQVFLIDLMSKEDYAGSHIPGAVNIPVEELEDRISEIPSDKTIVVACKRGLMKSDLALEKLRKSGIAATKVDGGTTAWLDYQAN